MWAAPKRWNRGTVTVRIYYTTTATDADGVTWGVKALALSDGNAFASAYGTAVTVDDTLQSATGLLLSITTGAVTIGGSPADGDFTNIRIFRDPTDAADTASEDAILVGAVVLYTSDELNDS